MNTKTAVIVGVGGAVLILAYLAAKKAGKVLSTDLNPASDKNLAYSGVNSALQATGVIGSNATLGTAFYDAIHNDDGTFNWFGLARKPSITAPTPIPQTSAPTPQQDSAFGTDADLVDWYTAGGFGA